MRRSFVVIQLRLDPMEKKPILEDAKKIPDRDLGILLDADQ